MVTSLTPVEAWAAANPQGWKYSWDLFFTESQMTDLQYQASNLVKTNKKVALFTDNEQDGAVMGALWASKAAKFGYTIAYHATFPVGTSDFGSFIAETKKAGATIIIAQMIPPDAFALWKQMKSLGYAPAVAFCEKCGNARSWYKELGDVGNGTMATTWWSPTLGRPQTKEFVDGYEAAFGNTSDLASVVATYSAAMVMIDAIKKAGSTDPEKVNAALAATDAQLPIAHIKFNDKHQSYVPALMAQWQGDNMPMVYPKINASVVAVKQLGLAQ
jgi:branched-chain amino acid transport system substrate-binding protein